jgi:hypothetical protein
VDGAAAEARVNGFGWNFYGFFLAALAWLVAYFLWAWRASADDTREEQ